MSVTEATPYELIELSELRRAARAGVARRLRELANVSQAELARALGVTPSAVSYFESGDRRPSERIAKPWLELLLAWAENAHAEDKAVAEMQRTAELLRGLEERPRREP